MPWAALPSPPGTFTGQIAVIKRGTCTFAVKVDNATAAGAIGVIIVNNAGGFPIVMSVPEATTIPSYMVSQADGNNLITWVYRQSWHTTSRS